MHRKAPLVRAYPVPIGDLSEVMTYPQNIQLVCLKCRTPLNSLSGTLRCDGCGQLISEETGFPDFVGSNDLEWGELENQRMDEVLQEARQSAWYVPILKIARSNPFLAYYVLDRSRAGWAFHCLKPENNNVCIDLGSGWGTNSFTLSDLYREVWSVETVRARLEFQSIRRDQERKTNVHLVRSSLLTIPLPDNSADLVVCNGVLEWIGLSDYQRPPAALQEQFLREAFRLVKPGGCLYIGIENRLGALYFLGAKDHSGLPFTSLVPRRLASTLVRRYRPKSDFSANRLLSNADWPDYRTYTYSLGGYKHLLRNAGFRSIEACWVWPDYNVPSYSGLFNSESLRFLATNVAANSHNSVARIGSALLRAAPGPLRVALASSVWPNFLLFAFKGDPDERLRDRILDTNRTGFMLASTARISAPKSTFLLLRQSRVTKAVTTTNEGAPGEALPSETRRVSLQHGNFRLAEEPGVDGLPLKPNVAQDSVRAMEWLVAFQKRTAQGPFTEGLWQRESARLETFLAEQEHADQLLPLANRVFAGIHQLVRQGGLEIAAEHGDFHHQNILRTRSGTLEVIDWGDARPVGNPLNDVGTYLAMLHRGDKKALLEMISKRGSLWRSASAAVAAYSAGTGVAIVSMDGLIGYALIRLLERDSITLNAHGKSVSKTFPGGTQLVLDALRSLPSLTLAETS